LAEQISWEAEQHIPFDINDVQVDYQVLREREEASQMDLLLVAAKSDQINAYAQLAREAKLRPEVVDIDAFAIQNLYEVTVSPPTDQTVALINVGAGLSSLNVITAGVSAFTREIASGGNVITAEIQRQLSVPREAAEAFKCGRSLDGQAIPSTVAAVVEQVLDSIAAEIQRSLDFFMATSGDGEIHRICLTGGTSTLGPLAGAIERRTRLPVQTWNPIDGFQIESTVPQGLIAEHGRQLAVSLGLTLRKDREVRK
jgi:type IV pilus assembly protein PilM